MEFHEEAFEAAATITAAIAEEADLKLDEESAEKVSEFFAVLYRKLAKVARGEDLKEKPKPGSFEMFTDARGHYRFRVKAANGKVIAASQAYKKKENCIKGMESIKKSSPEAEVKEV